MATQDVADYPAHARKMLNNNEWWVMLNMSEDELSNLSEFKHLNDTELTLLRSMRSEKNKYKEGVVTGMNNTFMQRFAVVPPALYLALGETDGEAKERRKILMDEHGLSDELDAALLKAREIEAYRRQHEEEV